MTKVVVFLLASLYPALLVGQVVRLPAVEQPEASPPAQLISHPDSTAEILQAPGEQQAAPASDPTAELKLPPGVRNGVFQKILFDTTWLAPGSGDGMGSLDVQIQGVFAVPCPKRESPLVMTPGFAVHYLEGPKNVDLPPQLHEGYMQFRWLSQVTPQLGLDLAVTPGYYSDFNQDSNNAYRVPAHAAAAWTWSETLKIAAGAAYLDMPSASNVIPIGGLIWTPSKDLQFDILFPHPKLAKRVYWSGHEGDDIQDWIYIAGEFANDSWAIRRSDGSDDQVMLRDYRLLLGVERKAIGGISSRFEVGYVFGRRIRYVSDTPDFYPSDTVLLRGGLTY